MKYGKTAFVVGVMFTVGKYVGEALIGGTEKVVEEALRQGGKNGNKFAQDVCKKAGMRIDNQPVTEDAVIGFKAE